MPARESHQPVAETSNRAAPLAVQFGAGNIGRGFMGELFCRAGYRTVFIDVDRTLVDAINRLGAYEVHHVTNDGDEPVRVAGISALDARDVDAVADAVARASLACTAVGARILKAVAPALARGIARRGTRRVCGRVARPGAGPLNVITCENLVGAGRLLRELVWTQLEHLAGDAHPAFSQTEFNAHFGFVEAVVSRMVPIVPDEVRRRDPLSLRCEPYARLPVDGPAFRGPVPPIPGLEPVGNILAHQRRKLATHNMSHAVCAYLGCQAGHEFIWQAVADAAIFRVVRGAMNETGRALVSRFAFKAAEQHEHEEDLLRRYRNRALGDQVRRVAADPLRKLGPDDRLIGSARLCLEEGVEPVHVIMGIRAALAYDNPQDPGALRLQEVFRTRPREQVLREVCGLSPDEPLFARLRE
jgi:mannitol-1-phosphate 5-dehydrogenase